MMQLYYNLKKVIKMCDKIKHSSSHRVPTAGRRAEVSARGESYPQDKPLKPQTQLWALLRLCLLCQDTSAVGRSFQRLRGLTSSGISRGILLFKNEVNWGPDYREQLKTRDRNSTSHRPRMRDNPGRQFERTKARC